MLTPLTTLASVKQRTTSAATAATNKRFNADRNIYQWKSKRKKKGFAIVYEMNENRNRECGEKERKVARAGRESKETRRGKSERQSCVET